MPNYYIFTEISVKSGSHNRLHRIPIPTPKEKGFYRTVLSLSAFNTGARKGASKEEKRIYRNNCCWTPDGLLYSGKREEEWISEQTRLAAKFPQLDERDKPKIEHESLWAFYEYIGFDYKKRKYVA